MPQCNSCAAWLKQRRCVPVEDAACYVLYYTNSVVCGSSGSLAMGPQRQAADPSSVPSTDQGVSLFPSSASLTLWHMLIGLKHMLKGLEHAKGSGPCGKVS
eukprot:1160238-Pelagomonas_calceolata.AAC.3